MPVDSNKNSPFNTEAGFDPGRVVAWHQIGVFVTESNRIEGIHREPTHGEMSVHMGLLDLKSITVVYLNAIQKIITPDRPMRSRPGMDVCVGKHVPPPGGPNILEMLAEIVLMANQGEDPWKVHILFEDLHPYMDGNGRIGRALWLWQMWQRGEDPFVHPFLHTFYYDTLSRSRSGIAYALPAGQNPPIRPNT